MSGIAFEEVSKVFPDGTVAVVDFDLRIGDGELCVLLGPSGCGKSTALRLVAGLETVSQGTIRLGDRVVNRVAPEDRDVAMVFEGSALYPHLAVADNIELPLKLAGAPAEERRKGLQRVAGRLALGGLLARRPRQLSAGERQRTALGRAGVRRPAAFLLDEPLSDLDARLRSQMRAAIAGWHRELGTTMLYVTHDQSDAMALGERVAVMRDGRLEQAGEPRALYDRPATLFVASFIGSPPMNFWHVRLIEDAGRVFLKCGTQRLVVPQAVLERRPGLRSRIGGHLVLGLRPEVLSLAGARATSALELPVTLVEGLGSHLLVHLEAEGAGMQLADSGSAMRSDRDGADPDAGGAIFTRPTASLIARLPAHANVEPGNRLRLSVDLERAHFFDATTQRALA